MGRSICSSESRRKSNEANGCITALCQFFRLHQVYFPSRHHHHQPRIHSYSTVTTKNLQYSQEHGLVAPRNSLELTEESSLSTNYKIKETLNIPVSRKKSTLRALLVDASANTCNSPGTKTPNVVARLMGLDLLPDNLDLNQSSRNGVRGHRLSGNGSWTRSLPESPRISCARISDFDSRRLSLQLNRENKHEEVGHWRLKELKQDEGSPSPRHKGRQIVKQIKERVTTRKFGMDITNLLESTRAGAAENKIEHSRFSQKENTRSINLTCVLRQDQVSLKPTSVTLSKDFKENFKGVNALRPINGLKKAESQSKFYPHPTLNNRNRQRNAFISKPKHWKSDRCDLLEKKKCKKTSAVSPAFSATERPWKQMERAEGNADAKICSGQKYKYEKKFLQELPSSNFCDSINIFATLANAEGTVKNLPGVKKIEDEEERVVAEIERRIVDALVHETTSSLGLNANAIRFVEPL